jgi:hypothetical protein
MKAEEFKKELISELIGNGCTISEKLLDNYLDTLISQVKVEVLTYQLERKPVEVIGQHIIEPIEPVTDPQL